MCLSKVSAYDPWPSGVGYKVIRKNMKPLFFFPVDLYRNGLERYYETLKWYTADNFHLPDGQLLAVSGKPYKCGFHIFKEIPRLTSFDRENLSVWKVLYEEAHTLGKQPWQGSKELDCVVAKRMMLLEQVNESDSKPSASDPNPAEKTSNDI